MIEDLLLTNNNKIVFLMLDRLSNIPNPEYSYQTSLEVAKKPNIDDLSTKIGESDRMVFHEKNCIPGSIGTIHSKQLMLLMMSHALKFDNYGA